MSELIALVVKMFEEGLANDSIRLYLTSLGVLYNQAIDDKVVSEITASCEAANFLGCKKMTVVGGNDQPGMTQEEMHANIITANPADTNATDKKADE